jgi:hypothetical protein
LPLPIDERVRFDENRKAQVVKDFHSKVWQHIEKMDEQYAFKTNKRKKRMVFELGDWVWVHMIK